MSILITGVAQPGQLGEALAQSFVHGGAAVTLLARDADAVRQRAEELRALGGHASAHVVDLTDADALADVAAAVAREVDGRLDALVLAAGGFAVSGPVDTSDGTGFHRMVAVNLTTAYLATRAFLPLVRAARGAIVYFTSAAVLPDGSPAGLAAYAAAKAGVVALMRAVAADEAPHGVRANAVALANVRTAANVAAMGDGARYVEREAVAEIVRWLCSSAARDITGQVIRVGR
ncbi:MAG TPA: SDR family oxidoreductase [Gemmatimonadaceae bacterium]|nr:SDR family oxidoreductase [Gemmatimonadaceae bacterium]